MQKKLRLSGSFSAPLCKGSSAAGGEGLFFYNPPTAARFPNPSRRGLQACYAYLQIPCVKGAPPQAVRDCYNLSRRRLQVCFAHSQIKPVSATPASVLRTLANPFAQGSFFINPFLFFFSHAKRYIKAKKLLKKSIKYDII